MSNSGDADVQEPAPGAALEPLSSDQISQLDFEYLTPREDAQANEDALEAEARVRLKEANWPFFLAVAWRIFVRR